MITRILAAEGERVYDDEVGRFVDEIPCHRCGVCCERWQAPVSEAEAARLAEWLGLPVERLIEQYTERYPFDEGIRLLRHEGGGCVFLRREADGRAGCAVHPARPDTCRTWTASLQRRECIDGLDRFGGAILPLTVIYPDAEERDRFADVLGVERGDER
jgi:Fe-S-cluster containining protein